MRKLAVFFLLMVGSQSVFAYTCRVDLVDRFNRVIDRFYGRSSAQGLCREGLRDCNYAKRVRNLNHAQCVLADNRTPGPTPGPFPPGPTPGPGRFQHLLYLTNHQLADEATFYGVGWCHIDLGSWNSACNYYVKRSGYGYPHGTGCAKREYTSQYGCHFISEKENAGCLIRRAIMRNDC